MAKVATSPLPPQGSPPLQSGGQNKQWPINGEGGYITPTASGILTASKRGAKSEVAHKWAMWLHHPCRFGDPHRFKAGAKSEMSNKRAEMQRHPCIMGGPQLRGQNQKWLNLGQGQNFGCAVQKNTTKKNSHKRCVCVEKHP